MTDTAIRLRALEHDVETLTALPLNELPHTARTILRSVASLLVATRWVIEDQEQARLTIVAGDGNDL